MHHTWLCIICHVYACVCTMLFASFRVASLGSFGFIPELWGFVRLRPFVFFLDSFFFLAGSQARWPLPSISLLSLLASCFVLSLCCATYHLFTMPPILPCQPLTFSPFLANRCLAMLPLCSAPLIALLVAGEVEDCSMMDRIILGYHNISYLSNASIYLVMGGRLGLLPGASFHFWRLSFCHTSVMFLDFAFLTLSGFMGPPWQFALNKTLPARPNFGFTICLITTKNCIGTSYPVDS